MHDGRLVTRTTDVCALCAEKWDEESFREYEQRIQLGEETLVLVESGQCLPMKKDPETLRFYADWLRPPKLQPQVVNAFVFHFQCLHNIMTEQDMEWDSCSDSAHCWCCQKDFYSNRWAHRFTIGAVGQHDEFEQDVDVNLEYRPLMCSHCTMVVFGQGDAERGDNLLNGGDQQAYGR